MLGYIRNGIENYGTESPNVDTESREHPSVHWETVCKESPQLRSVTAELEETEKLPRKLQKALENSHKRSN